MTTARTAPEPSLRPAAMVAGSGLLAMTVLATFGFAVFNDLVVETDATNTAHGIVEHELLFRLFILSFLLVAVLDVVVAWALYVLMSPAGRHIAVLAAWLRAGYAVLLAAALSDLLGAVRRLTEAGSRGAFDTHQVETQALMSVTSFKDGWDAALTIFGLHLLVLGYLVFRSGYIPRALGVFLVLASVGYVVDGVGRILSADYDTSIAGFTFIGEVLFMGWLLWRGRRLPGGPGTMTTATDRPVTGDL